jgi:hypothetical protein
MYDGWLVSRAIRQSGEIIYLVVNWLIIKARRMRWAGHVTRMGEKRNAYCWWESQREATRKTKT